MIFRVRFRNDKAFEECYPDPFYDADYVSANEKVMKNFLKKYVSEEGEIMIEFRVHQNKVVVIPVYKNDQ